MNLTFVNQTKFRMPRKFLSQWCKKIERQLQKRKIKIIAPQKELTIVFVSQAEMTKLNYSFRKRKRPTDVLSFTDPYAGNIGELILCPQVILKQSSDHGLTFREELGYMILHGTLHLLGYEHESSKIKAKKMFSLQDDIFAKIKP